MCREYRQLAERSAPSREDDRRLPQGGRSRAKRQEVAQADRRDGVDRRGSTRSRASRSRPLRNVTSARASLSTSSKGRPLGSLACPYSAAFSRLRPAHSEETPATGLVPLLSIEATRSVQQDRASARQRAGAHRSRRLCVSELRYGGKAAVGWEIEQLSSKPRAQRLGRADPVPR